MTARGSYNRFDAKKAKSLAKAGFTAKEIIDEMKIPWRTVYDGLRRHRIAYTKNGGGCRVKVNQKVHSTCVKYYGKRTASVIGEQLGITRNAVIGHWQRAKWNGEITT